jgi:hypothetical protein
MLASSVMVRSRAWGDRRKCCAMAQRLPRDEEVRARYFPDPDAGRDRELHGDEDEVHA